MLLEESAILPALPDNLADVHAMLARFRLQIEQAGYVIADNGCWLMFTTAVLEIGGNITRHAYQADAPCRRMRLRLRAFPNRLTAAFADRGIVVTSFVTETAYGDELLALPESGMGLALSRAAVDSLHYRRTSDGVNCWRLVKRFPMAQPGDG